MVGLPVEVPGSRQESIFVRVTTTATATAITARATATDAAATATAAMPDRAMATRSTHGPDSASRLALAVADSALAVRSVLREVASAANDENDSRSQFRLCSTKAGHFFVKCPAYFLSGLSEGTSSSRGCFETSSESLSSLPANSVSSLIVPSASYRSC